MFLEAPLVRKADGELKNEILVIETQLTQVTAR